MSIYSIYTVYMYLQLLLKKMFGNSDNCFSIMWRLKP